MFLWFFSVKPLINLIETTRRVGSMKFAKLIENSNFAKELMNGPPLTLFVPSDDALEVCYILTMLYYITNNFNFYIFNF